MNNDFMELALSEAKNSGNDVPVGAVIVEDNKVIAFAHNKKEALNDITAHAEIIALKKAAAYKGNWHLNNCEMYVTLEPCPMCASAIINSLISTVYFGAYDNLYGALGSKTDLRQIFNSKMLIYGGIMEEACSQILKEFWKKNGKS